MPYVAAEAIEAARQIDLLSYLRTQEPGELVHVSGSTYCTREHDSLKISNGKWHWFSRGIGGRNALDYLVKVKEMSFPDAVSLLTGTPLQAYTAPQKPVIPREHRLLLPDVDTNSDTVKRYLEGRGSMQLSLIIASKRSFFSRRRSTRTPCLWAMTGWASPATGRCAAPSAGSNPRPPAVTNTTLFLHCGEPRNSHGSCIRGSHRPAQLCYAGAFTRASTGSRMRCCLWPGYLPQTAGRGTGGAESVSGGAPAGHHPAAASGQRRGGPCRGKRNYRRPPGLHHSGRAAHARKKTSTNSSNCRLGA